ncbi:uncharacterized protein N7498_002119 [Penicillium cinerascens]|uniref:Uncharacterized protein n=1 Tax=Penicillium cinerascens TaxID=70096 RepID=A0A9W9N9G2_9EURO|nr:uncharacterized protein N7498_002119 [Penicillium cinerascens]KAJ5215712.1 hypothetical protein N7498_002119 [Penicillium cinerascens]
MAAQAQPRILLITLDKVMPEIDEVFADLIHKFSKVAQLQRTRKPDASLRVLSENPKAVFLTDGALSKPKYASLWDAVLEYARNGGTCQPPDIKSFFAKAGLPWEMAGYHRTTVSLNRQGIPRDVTLALQPSYSQKAIFLKGVDPSLSWYNPTSDSTTQSMVFDPESVDTTTCPVAMANVGEGKLGYVGDVNGEQGSTLVVLAMSGLFSTA